MRAELFDDDANLAFANEHDTEKTRREPCEKHEEDKGCEHWVLDCQRKQRFHTNLRCGCTSRRTANARLRKCATRFSDWVNVGVPHGTLEDRPSKCRRG